MTTDQAAQTEPAGAVHLPNEVILASAGTGKTQRLSARYLQLIDRDHAPERILATTFTRKAAGEIFERIMQRLTDSIHDDSARRFLGEQLGREISVARCQELLIRLTRNLHRIHIGTLDHFFQQIASSLAFELGLPGTWDIADERDEDRLQGEALRRMLAKHTVSEVTKLVHMLAKGDAERKTNDFLIDIVERLHLAYRDALHLRRDPWKTRGVPVMLDAETFQQAFQALTDCPIAATILEKPHQKTILDVQSEDWNSVLTKGLGPKILSNQLRYRSGEITPDLVAVYDPILRHASASILHQEIQKVAGAQQLIDKFASEYKEVKREYNVLCFDDIPLQLASLNASARRRIAYRMDAQLDHLLLDEFQDTSGTQWRAIRPFAEQITRDPSSGGSVFCVGDVKQAIYGWRGGQAEILKTLHTQLPNITSEQLTKTYRCSQPVVDTVNRVFANLDKHPKLDAELADIASWKSSFEAHQAAGDHPGHVTLVSSGWDEEEGKPTTTRSMAQMVKSLAEDLGPNRSIGVLVRTNQAVREVINELRATGIWASQEGASPLVDSAAVQQILSACRLADLPSHDIARFHLQQGLFPLSLGAETSDNIRPESAREIAAEYRKQLVEKGYGETVQQWAECLLPLCSVRERDRLAQLVDLAFVFQSRISSTDPALRPLAFVDFIEKQGVSQSTSSNIRVMVIHQSKGLEFDAVVLGELHRNIAGQPPRFVIRRSPTDFAPEHIFTYLRDAENSAYPDAVRKSLASDREERCHATLCGLYVAMTRARHALHMIVPTDNPEKKRKRPELPKNVGGLLRSCLCDNQPVEPDQVLFVTGDPNWFRDGADDAGTALQDSSSPDRTVPTIRLKKRSIDKETGTPNLTRRAQEAVSPSQRSAGAVVSGAEWFAKDRSHAMEHGSLIHAWLEQIQWLDHTNAGDSQTDLLDNSMLRKIAICLPVHRIDVDKALVNFHTMLKQPAIGNLLRQAPWRSEFARWWKSRGNPAWPADARIEVYNEQPIVFFEDGICGTGTIDRLVLIRVADDVIAADVIDHKTDRAKSAAKRQEKAEFYAPQLRRYRDAVCEMFAIDPMQVRMRLAMTGSGTVVDVP